MGVQKVKKPFRWAGSKAPLLNWLLPLIPPGGRPYTEAYFGSGAVLLNREPAKTEAVNDIDGNIVNFFRVLQKRDSYEELKHRLRYTPYSYEEFRLAHEILAQRENAHPVDRAWAFFVVQNQGFNGEPYGKGWGFRPTTPLSSYLNAIDALDWFVDRLRLVQIDHRDALEFLTRWDTEEAIHYVDPPYLHATRYDKHIYKYEMKDNHHEQLVSLLLNLKGAVVLSGFPNSIYCALEEAGWARYDHKRYLRFAPSPRMMTIRPSAERYCIESVWLNPKAQSLVRVPNLYSDAK